MSYFEVKCIVYGSKGGKTDLSTGVNMTLCGKSVRQALSKLFDEDRELPEYRVLEINGKTVT